jgi:hypothetical protein
VVRCPLERGSLSAPLSPMVRRDGWLGLLGSLTSTSPFRLGSLRARSPHPSLKQLAGSCPGTAGSLLVEHEDVLVE